MTILCLPKKSSVFIVGHCYGSNLFDDALIVRRTDKSVWMKVVPEEYNTGRVFRKKVLYDPNGNEVVIENGPYRNHGVGWFSEADHGACT